MVVGTGGRRRLDDIPQISWERTIVVVVVVVGGVIVVMRNVWRLFGSGVQR